MSKCILVVEDQEDNQQILRDLVVPENSILADSRMRQNQGII